LKKVLEDIRKELFEEWKTQQDEKKKALIEKKRLGEEKRNQALEKKNSSTSKILDLNEAEPPEEQYTEPLSDQDIESIIKIIIKKYPNGVFPYH